MKAPLLISSGLTRQATTLINKGANNMVDCTTVFETLTGFLVKNILEKAVEETNAEHGTKKFTVLRQLNTMMWVYLI